MQYANMMNDTATALRLKEIRERSKVSLRRVARELGMSPAGYAHYEDPKRFKRGYLPVKIAEGIIAALSPAGIDEAEIWALTGATQNPSEISNGEPTPHGSHLVPIYNVEASAGNGFHIGDEYQVASLSFPEGYLQRVTRANPRNLAVISVKGDSMTPTLSDDDVVMLDTTKLDLSYDGLFVIRDSGNALLVKRIGRASRSGFVSMISDNKEQYPAVERALGDIEVIGKVIWKGGKV
jgi:phage repressor protein C with HTH and peptisase S24 domain